MPCEHYKDALIEAASSDGPQGELRAHLDACTACRAVFAQEQALFSSIDAGLRQTANVEVPASLLPRIRAGLDDADARRSRWIHPLIFAAASLALVVMVFLVSRPQLRKLEEQAAHTPVAPSQEAPAKNTRSETARLNTRTTSSKSNRARIGRNSVSLLPAASSQPEVLVPADEREAFAHFVATLQERSDVAVALLTPSADKKEGTASLEPLQINQLEVKPLEGTITGTSGGAEEIR